MPTGSVEVQQRMSSDTGKGSTYREVSGELSSDDTVRTMVAGDLAPHDTELVALCLVDVGDLLSVVEVATFLVLDTVNLDEGGLVVYVTTASAITNINH